MPAGRAIVLTPAIGSRRRLIRRRWTYRSRFGRPRTSKKIRDLAGATALENLVDIGPKLAADPRAIGIPDEPTLREVGADEAAQPLPAFGRRNRPIATTAPARHRERLRGRRRVGPT